MFKDIQTTKDKLKQATTTETITSERIYQKINSINNMMTNMSLESERAIKARGKYKWCKEAIKCQKECVKLQIEAYAKIQQGSFLQFKFTNKTSANVQSLESSVDVQQQYCVVKVPLGQVGSDWGQGQWARWDVHGLVHLFSQN